MCLAIKIFLIAKFEVMVKAMHNAELKNKLFAVYSLGGRAVKSHYSNRHVHRTSFVMFEFTIV